MSAGFVYLTYELVPWEIRSLVDPGGFRKEYDILFNLRIILNNISCSSSQRINLNFSKIKFYAGRTA